MIQLFDGPTKIDQPAERRSAHAHTSNQDGDWLLLEKHLISVGDLAAGFARDFGSEAMGRLAGLLHDIGKVDAAFQEYLRSCWEAKQIGLTPQDLPVPHAIDGAHYAVRWGLPILSIVVEGHHGGLSDLSVLKTRLAYAEESGSRIARLSEGNLKKLLSKNRIRDAKLPLWAGESLSFEFLARMLFSALIDADHADTEAHFGLSTGRRRQSTTWADLHTKLETDHMEFATRNSDSQIDTAREQVRDAAMRSAERPQGVFKFTAPTGMGRTRALMAFAVPHAAKYGLKRIIVARPHGSETQRTADMYRSILGFDRVLEQYSAPALPSVISESFSEADVRRQLDSCNWEEPVVITTDKQLLESLFSNKPSRCRKLHNLAKSVIIMEEIQTLPHPLLQPALQVIRELVEHYGVTLVLSSATPSALSSSRPYMADFHPAPAEIAPEACRYSESLKRARWEIAPKPWSWNDAAEEMRRHEQVLCVVNTRTDALSLFNALDYPESLHLSSMMCSAHRRRVLSEIEERLSAGKPCRVVSSAIVDHDIDLDFPTVFRAIGPLDRMVQSWGRCNRNGRLSEPGKFVAFDASEGAESSAIAGAREILSDLDANPDDPSVLERYFDRLWRDRKLDPKGIGILRKRLSFATVSELFRVTDEPTEPVIVRFGSPGPSEQLDRIRWNGYITREDWGELQAFSVEVLRSQHRKLSRSGLLEEIIDGLNAWVGEYDEFTGMPREINDPLEAVE